MELFFIITSILTLTIFSVSGIFYGIRIMSSGFHQIQLAHASYKWPTTFGQIIDSQIDTKKKYDDGITYKMYKPLIRFNYHYQERDFIGETIFFGDGGLWFGYGGFWKNNRESAERFIQKYPIGKAVLVSYNRINPSQSVLEPGLTKKSFSEFTYGVQLFFIGIVCFITVITTL